ncbi:MAG: asparagine synthase-related protein [Candidatus Binatus sp.]
MSGIGAIFNRDGRPVEIRTITAMLDAVNHRGPDGGGMWAEGAVALGQRMLHATPEAIDEQQPWSDEAARYRLVFDGRIDNGTDLRPQLVDAGLELRNNTDAELVLRSYQCWGEEFAVKLIGDFAIVIWDSQTRTLICARDPTGMKPFYYYADRKKFVCGSELHQLFHCDVPCEPNEEVVGEYLANRTDSAEPTLYRSIHQLLAAHLLIVGRDRLVTRRYYDLDPAREIRHRNDDEYANHFLSIFTEAVRCRLRAAGMVASDLSGGLDSSSIVSVARILQEQGAAGCDRFESFSQVFPGLLCDESEYIKAVGAKCAVALNLELSTPSSEVDLAAQVRQFRDFPNYPNLTSGFGFRRLGRRKGARVTLTGEGGDEWFGGCIDDNADLLRSLRIAALVRQVRIDADQSETRSMTHSGRLRLFLRTAAIPLLPPAVREFARWRLRPGRLPYPDWVTPDFVRRTDLYERLIAEQRGSPVRGIAHREIYELFRHAELPVTAVMVEQAIARIGQDTRRPFNDRRLIEFAFALPNDQLRRGGYERYIVRNAMTGILPEAVRMRVTKAGFNAPVLESVKHNAALISLDKLEIAQRGWVDAAKLKSGFQVLMGSYRNGEGDYGFPVWMALATEIWHRVMFGSGKLER